MKWVIPDQLAQSGTSFAWGKGGKVTTAGVPDRFSPPNVRPRRNFTSKMSPMGAKKCHGMAYDFP